LTESRVSEPSAMCLAMLICLLIWFFMESFEQVQSNWPA
jgi:hypothetical protein